MTFFQNFKTRQRETLVKENLTKELNMAIKDVQLNKTLQENDVFITSDEAGKNLVTVLEGIFVHGVRESFVDKLSSAFNDLDRKPTPEFWSPMMIFTHRDTISQLNSLSQINTDIGRSRSWIRLTLNEGVFLGYLLTIAQETKTLKSFYKNTAYLLDLDRLNIAISYFQGLSQFKFRFPINSSVMNHWPDETLLIAGLWTNALKDCPVSTAMDIVKSLPASDPDAVSVHSSSSSTAFQKGLLDDDAALELIINTPTEGSPMQSRMESEQEQVGSDKVQSDLPPAATNIDEEITQSEGLNTAPCVLDLVLSSSPHSAPEGEILLEPPTPAVFDTLESYDRILENYSPKSPPLIPEPQLQDILIEYGSQTSDSGSALPVQNESNEECGGEFTIIEKPSSSSIPSDFKHMVDLLCHGKIVQEPGLCSQNFCCKSCQSIIEPISVKARVCSLTGFYYCGNCFKNSECVIPSRIVHNWDFGKYPVSPPSEEFLNLIYMHPLINIRRINPRIYFAIEEMHIIHKLRLTLNHLRQYLFTCHDKTKNRLQSMLWPREYLYEHVHVYSIRDLMEAANGSLIVLLKKAISISETHVRSCTLCSQKGFLCELCRKSDPSPEPIFPFDVDNVYRCTECRSIYHKECMKAVDGCRKCSRIQMRKTQILTESFNEN